MPLGGHFKTVWVIESTELLNCDMGQAFRKACIQVPMVSVSVEELAGSNDNTTHASRSEGVDRREMGKRYSMFIQTYICGPNWSRLLYPHNRGRSLIIMYNVGQTSQREMPIAGQIRRVT